MKSFYILRHQTVHYPTVKDNVDLELLSTPQCKVRNSSYEFAVLSKNKIPRDFWETQSLKNGLNRQFWKKIARLWLRHLRFESLLQAERVTRLSGPIQNLWFCKWVMFLLRVYNAIKPVTSFCQVFKVEICEANTTVTWQVDIICHKKELKIQLFFLLPCPDFQGVFYFSLLYCLSIKNTKVAIKRITYLTSLYGGKYAPYW